MPTRDDKVRRTLLLEVHRLVATVAAEAAGKIGRANPRRRRRPRASPELPVPEGVDRRTWRQALASMERHAKQLLSYPPKEVLSHGEELALTTMRVERTERRALEKLIADACASAFFHFFCLVDAVGSPEIATADQWFGARIVAPPDDGDVPFLHDQFYDLYWAYERAMAKRAPKKGVRRPKSRRGIRPADP